MDGEILGPISSYLSQIIWIIVIIVLLSVAAFVLPYIFEKIFSKKRVCSCGYKLNKNDVFCPKCGRRVIT